MARQCWDEARHVEISCKLSDHMGSTIGEFAEQTLLYEAACNPDPVLRLTGVNRALEGLAIDVFKTMRDFGQTAAPIRCSTFCEDWMLADEVTHVKMGSDWLRRLTANDPERQKQALDFQKAVDKLFSFGGFRGEQDENPVHLARNFRRLAGFTDDEIAELVDIAAEAYAEAAGRPGGRAGRRQRLRTAPVYAITLLDVHTRLGLVRHHRQRARRPVGARGQLAADAAHAGPVVVHRPGRADDLRPGRPGRRPGGRAELRGARSSTCSTASSPSSPWASSTRYRTQMRHRLYLLYGLGGLFLMGLGIRAMLVGKT